MSGFPTGYFMDAPTLNAWLLGWFDFALFGTTLTWVSTDGPTFVFSINADVTAVVEPGMRVRLTQTTAKYFIVTAVGAYSGGVTQVTIYGGTDYTLLNAAISAGAFSTHKKPFGFNASPLKWREELRDTSTRTQSSPAAGTWYNPGALSLSIPIGAWDLLIEACVTASRNGSSDSGKSTLSTANNSESDSDFTAFLEWASVSATDYTISHTSLRRKTVLLAAKTSYFINVQTPNASTSVSLNNPNSPLIVRAVCAYL